MGKDVCSNLALSGRLATTCGLWLQITRILFSLGTPDRVACALRSVSLKTSRSLVCHAPSCPTSCRLLEVVVGVKDGYSKFPRSNTNQHTDHNQPTCRTANERTRGTNVERTKTHD
eukprot:7388337-Prymnesium_polylepis.1